MSFKQAFSFISAKELATLLRNPGLYPSTPRLARVDGLRKENKIAVVDVRDDDYEGGHIKGCIHSPSAGFLDGGVESVREKTKETPVVVFHCALSQVRGPKAARIYAETTDEVRKRGGDAPIPQEVLVLRGGFTEFQALFRHDKDLVED
ncbi:SubName: Full=Uncharacterized protein {ECO:0000313/EMBL:CCA67661.1} [Serendipita indica DSM 11827]|nr:SubName: Full=Uncharacterized protein {ECO:0000313/EMBL:CCA67661.1} [Serendipita indica DSM 11827]